MPFLLLGLVLLPAGVQLRVLWAARRLRGRRLPEVGEGRYVFYFHSPACGPCRALAPTVQRLASGDGRLHAVDVTATPALAQRFGVMATPTFVVVDDGCIEAVLPGPITEARLKTLLAGPG